ncbi:hypothetical protein AGDE_13776 [Angomonas deanei]|uniref:Uncharacterized protein n=1 Tax=Angomonas deanei TaxID=59799 RepID=A0A7G2CTG5_9TRYP|nr:hypothetical protein AGDE_13776 [Angomonas deanei]CAD2221733.1 hypothetical protein, conserved [Angomonas deanei]|eukprot:EPY21818.1 hypothetical protein AGDE_13776 [Angomonas deanei]
MFAIEFTSTRPQGAAPYYSLVVREEYSLGSDPSCDIILSSPDILPQHVGLLVMRQSEANAEAEAAGGEGVYLDPPEGDGLGEQDPLVVFLTVLEPEEGTAAGGVVYVGDTEVPPGGSIILTDGTEAQFGASAAVVFHFRPLVVCVDSDLFHPDQAQDYLNLFYRLGATVCEVPTLNLQLPTPIGLLHCVEELSDDLSTVIALACGYTIVQPTYVLEWFAALAQKASSPLSVLPPPRRFEVPIRTVVNAATVTYTRPETDSAPFSLYPIPSTAVKSRSRESLFENQVFYFFTEAAAARYRLAVQQSGGTCVFPTEKEEALHNVRLLSVEQTPAPADRQPTDPFPVNFYIVVDSVAEATLLNEGLRGSSQELADFLEEAEKAGALYLPIIGDHTLFSSLLSNRLSLRPHPPSAPRSSRQRSNPWT